MHDSSTLPDGAAIARNTLYNLAGYGAPLLIALFAIPVLIAGLDSDGFGMLAIAWMFLGYFSLFDLGLSRALTQLMAERLGAGRDEEVPRLVWTTLLSSLAIGSVVALILYAASPAIAGDLLNVPPRLEAASLRAFQAIACAVPFIIMTANMRGTLEALQRFDLVNVMRMPLGIATFGVPLVVWWLGGGLFEMVAGLAAARIVGWAVYVTLLLRTVPSLRRGVVFDRGLLGTLFRFGGWMTVSNVVSPLMTYMDRFLIGVVMTASAVAYYATPWEVVTKLLLIPTALAAVLFPSFSYLQRRRPEQTLDMFRAGIKAALLVLFPVVLLLIVFARPGLSWWIGPSFAEASYVPMQILALGVLFNGTAAIPFALVQGLGKPEITARIHLIEFPIYVGLLWILLDAYGIVGAAAAWSIRVVADFALLYVASLRTLRLPAIPRGRMLAAPVTAAMGGVAVMLPSEFALQALLGCLVLIVFCAINWRYILDVSEKRFLYRSIGRYLRWT